MADTNHPAEPCPDARPEVVLADAGAWISGPGITTEPVTAADVQPGDVLVLYGTTIAEVTVTLAGTARGGHGLGRVLWWQERGGTGSGVMVRADGDVLQRVFPA